MARPETSQSCNTHPCEETQCICIAPLQRPPYEIGVTETGLYCIEQYDDTGGEYERVNFNAWHWGVVVYYDDSPKLPEYVNFGGYRYTKGNLVYDNGPYDRFCITRTPI